jgi:hypothetical protein
MMFLELALTPAAGSLLAGLEFSGRVAPDYNGQRVEFGYRFYGI